MHIEFEDVSMASAENPGCNFERRLCYESANGAAKPALRRSYFHNISTVTPPTAFVFLFFYPSCVGRMKSGATRSRRAAATRLPAGEGAALGHGSVLLLEAVSEPLGALEDLVDAPHDAALLARAQRLGGEVGDAVVEAALDQVRVHLRKRQLARADRGLVVGEAHRHELPHLLALHAALQLTLLST